MVKNLSILYTVKLVLSDPSKKRQNKDLNDKLYLIEGQIIAECLPWSILQYF